MNRARRPKSFVEPLILLKHQCENVFGPLFSLKKQARHDSLNLAKFYEIEIWQNFMKFLKFLAL